MERPLCRGVFALVLLVAGYATQIGGLTTAAELTSEQVTGFSRSSQRLSWWLVRTVSPSDCCRPGSFSKAPM